MVNAFVKMVIILIIILHVKNALVDVKSVFNFFNVQNVNESIIQMFNNVKNVFNLVLNVLTMKPVLHV